MRHAISVAAAVLLAVATSPASAADDRARGEGSSGAKSRAEQAREKLEKVRESRRSAARPETPKQKEADADRRAALRAKSTYMYAVEACDQPARCDASLRDDSERAFMDACNTCASADRCEAERDAIRAGTARRIDNPCPPPR